jgi:hypothetical protein
VDKPGPVHLCCRFIRDSAPSAIVVSLPHQKGCDDRVNAQIHTQVTPAEKSSSVAPSRRRLVQRKCACGATPGLNGECAECDRKRLTLQRRPVDQADLSAAPPIVHDVLNSPGQPLDANARAFMEPRFGHDFSRVRVHADTKAAESARAVNAAAYTVGRDIVFGTGQYAPHSARGQRVLAHELTHVVQQDRGVSSGTAMGQRNDAPERAAEAAAALATLHPNPGGLVNGAVARLASTGEPVPALQRQESSATDTRTEDPNFLLCLILCYLGIPPAIWKSAVELFLRAVWEEYRGTYDQARAEREFRSYREEFRLYTPFKTVKLILTFAVQGKIGPILIRTAGARALQARITAYLIERGATAAGLAVAEQIVRKIALAVEAAFVAGCAAYCGGIAYANAIIETGTAIIQGIAETADVLGRVAHGALVGLFLRPVLVARATVDPVNWDLEALPSGVPRNDIAVLGTYLWWNLEPDNPDRFLANISRPLSSYPIPSSLLQGIATTLTNVVNRRGGFNQSMVFTPQLLQQMTPLMFVEFLKDWRLLQHRRDPGLIADEVLYGTQAP